MAPALTSNSFHLASGSYLKPNSKATKTSFIICAKQNPFGIGRGKEDSTAGENQADNRSKPNRFFFDIGKSLVPVVSSPSTSLFLSSRRKDPRTVYVAGATGQAGIRIAQTLLRQGFTVRAAVPDLASAQELARLAATYKIISPEESKRLNAVESGFDGGAETIARAIGSATKVVVTIGPGENGPANEVTTDDALQVVRAAQLAGVAHVAVVFDSGAGAAGSTYNVLDGITSFFSNLFSRSQSLTLGEFLSKVAETDVSYTLIKATLTDDYAAKESSGGLLVSQEGTIAGTPEEYSKVARSQIATLVADVFANTSVAENKVVEVSASSSATSKAVSELFSAIPEDGRRKALQEALSKVKAEEEALIASQRAREAAEAVKKLEREVTKLSEEEARAASLVREAEEKAQAAGSSLESLLSRAKDIGGGFSLDKFSSQIATAVSQRPEDDEPKAQITTIRGEAKARKLPPQKAVVKQSTPKSKAGKPEPKPEPRNVFGGLFKQATIYVDDD